MQDDANSIISKISPKRLFALLRFKFLKKHPWAEYGSNTHLKQKQYRTYQDYLDHQKQKLGRIKKQMVEYDVNYHGLLLSRLKERGYAKPGMTVLCLAARLGTEVKSFLDLGCFALGIDLNPGKENKYVVFGDFHNIQYPDKLVDIVFCNSLDHSLDLKKLIREIKRVLKPNGYAILELVKGKDEGGGVGYWESIAWQNANDVLKMFNEEGFATEDVQQFEQPWGGYHVTMRLSADNAS